LLGCVTASIAVSLALVEAIGGRATAAAVAAKLGVLDWNNRHRSDQFKLGFSDVHSRTYRSKAYALAATNNTVISLRGLHIMPDRLDVLTFNLSTLR
jgi:hypothetical protein